MKKGIYLAFATAVVSGWAVFINKFALSHWNSSTVYTTEKNIIAGILLSVLILGSVLRQNLASLTKKQWLKLMALGAIGGSLPFILFFRGLKIASSSNVALINKTLFVWVAILAYIFLKERLSKIQLFAFILLILGNVSLFYPKSFHFGYSELLILGATLLWSLEYFLAKKFVKNISPVILAWGRMFFGSIILIIYLIVVGQGGNLLEISAIQLPWILVVGVTLFGYVLFWYGAIKRIPVSTAAAILVIASPLTTLLNNIYVHKALPNNFWMIFLIIVTGIVFLTIEYLRMDFYGSKKIT